MTKAVRFHELGGPEVLQLEDVEIGDPGAGEIRVNMQAIGLNRAEAMFRQGAYLEQPNLPSGIGYEGAGVVDTVGDGVSGFAPGDKVSIIPAFSMNAYNVYGEQAIVPARAVVKRPDSIDAVQGSAIWMPYLTAYGALIDIGKLAKGQTVVITAASSSVGVAAIQIANSVGATSIATTRGADKADALKQAGADHVIVTDDQDVTEEIRRITDGKGAQQIFDPIAGPGVEALAGGVAPGGIVFIYGALSGQPTPFPLMPALSKALTLRGYTLFEIAGNDDRFEKGKAFITKGLEAGDFKPTVSKTFVLDAIADAHRYMESNRQFGKIVVTV